MHFTTSGQNRDLNSNFKPNFDPELTGVDGAGDVARRHWTVPIRVKESILHPRIQILRLEGKGGGAHRGDYRRRGSAASAWTPTAIR
jgi:hypothetical protein